MAEGRYDATVARLRSAGCVFAEDEAALLLSDDPDDATLEHRVRRRSAGEPVEHVLGWAWFCGQRVRVEPGVFVPRRRTELLAEQALAGLPPDATVVELCCGCAAVSSVLLARGTVGRLWAVDVDPVAVACAQRNLGDRATVLEGDLVDPLPDSLAGRVDVLVANTPYVPTGQLRLLPPEARDHEPAVALDGGTDGLDVQRRVARQALRWLRPGGVLLVECSDEQAEAAAAVQADAGLVPQVLTDPERSATVVLGTRPPLR